MENKMMLNKNGDIREVSSFIETSLFLGRVYLTHREETHLLHIPCCPFKRRTRQVLFIKQRWPYRL